MHSCIYRGHVRHRRRTPVKNEFRYRVYLLYLDLDELDQVFERHWLWSSRRRAFAKFDHRDHLVNLEGVHSNTDLKPKIKEILRNRGIDRPIGAVRLLTQLRYLGLGMNPVSFYYCFDEYDEKLEAVVVEVNNTPWGEQHIYVLDARNSESTRMLVANRINKEFHVSPFMSLDMSYSMRFTQPGRNLAIGMKNHQQSRCFFDVGMVLEREPITSLNLARTLMQYPLISFKVVSAIYWQALKLWLKRCPFYPHPKNDIEPIIMNTKEINQDQIIASP